MNGRNTMELNQATMATALQHYFDTVVFKDGQSPIVGTIEAKTADFTTVFKVTVEEPAERAEKKAKAA